MSPHFHPIAIEGQLVFDVVIAGITDASATRKFSIPCTFSSGETTDSAFTPIRQVEVG